MEGLSSLPVPSFGIERALSHRQHLELQEIKGPSSDRPFR